MRRRTSLAACGCSGRRPAARAQRGPCATATVGGAPIAAGRPADRSRPVVSSSEWLFLHFEAFQILLRKQVEVLLGDMGLPQELEVIGKPTDLRQAAADGTTAHRQRHVAPACKSVQGQDGGIHAGQAGRR